MLDFGLTQWTREEKQLDYFIEHVSHPTCNTLPLDSIIDIIKKDMGEPHDGAKKVKQMLLEHPKYDTIWRLIHKIRSAMGKRDALYQLEGAVKFDEGYFEKATSEKVKLKRGRGSQRQVNVAEMAESTPLEDLTTGKTSSHCGYFKMRVLHDHKSSTIDQTMDNTLAGKNIVFSDKSTSYVNISDYVDAHFIEKLNKQTTKSTLKWVHIAISNAKRMLLGVFHKIKGKSLQQYLDEFCYKLNRRYFGNRIFDRLNLAVAKCYW